MTAARYDVVDKKLNELIELFPKLVKPPVNLKNIMSSLSIKFEEKDYEGQLSGAAIFNGNEMIVTVSSKEPESRKRFTIAHEIGHLLLHADQALNIDIKPVTLNRDLNSSTGESSLRKTKRPFPDSSLAARARRALLNEGFPGKPYVA